MLAENFFGAGAQVAVMAEDGRELGGILVGDFRDRAREEREADREDTLLAAREDAAAQVQRGEGGFVNWRRAEIVGDHGYFFGFFGGGGDGFAELGEAEHSERTVSHVGSLRLPEAGDSHRMTALETIQ